MTHNLNHVYKFSMSNKKKYLKIIIKYSLLSKITKSSAVASHKHNSYVLLLDTKLDQGTLWMKKTFSVSFLLPVFFPVNSSKESCCSINIFKVLPVLYKCLITHIGFTLLFTCSHILLQCHTLFPVL